MSTTISTEPTRPQSTESEPRVGRRPRHRTLLAAVVAGALGIGVGAAAVSRTSSGGSGRPPTHSAAPASPHVDAPALWNAVNTLPVGERDSVVAALAPGVRAQLRAAFEEIAVAAEN